MSNYSIVLFVHIVGTLGFFVALGLEWTGLRQLGQAAAAEQVRAMMRNSQGLRQFGIRSMLAVLASGLYMTATAWGGRDWIIVTLGALVLGVVLSLAVTGPRMAAIGRALASEQGPVSAALRDLLNDPLLWLSLRARVAIALGIIWLKLAKPDLAGSLLTLGIAVALGLISAVPMTIRRQARVTG